MEKSKEKVDKVGSVIVVGGGIGGMQAALDLAESGIKVYLVEKSSAIGGRMVQLDKTFPTNECAMCVVSPKLVECSRHLNIEIITNSQIEEITGEPGNFKVTLQKKARFVDIEKCTACSECIQVCPVDVSSEFDGGITNHKAIHRLYPQAVPAAFIISKKDGISPCRVACPAGVNAHGYVALISQGKFKEALELIREQDPFPSICARVCYHPCENDCLRNQVDESISIRALKKFVAEYQLKEENKEVVSASDEDEHKPEGTLPANGIKIAIIGAGPAGLTCAYDLVRWGYKVVVYEKLSKPGGMMLTGIPDYRLPKEILDREISRLTDLGIEIKTDAPINSKMPLSDLQKEYKAIFIAVGAHSSRKLGVPGEDAKEVIPGVDFLREFNLNKKVSTGKQVVVVGGGNVAIDSARSSLRLGADEVTIVYRRSRQEMPANPGEIEEACEEGVKFHFLAAPTRILTENNKVTGMECVRMELGEPDSSGRRRPVPVKGSEFEIKTDLIIPAIGQLPDLSFLSEKVNKTNWGTIEVDQVTLETSRRSIFAGGDAVLGPATVVEAMAAGHRAACSIDRYIKGQDLKQGREAEKKAVSTIPERVLARETRVKVPVLPLKERRGNFKEVEMTINLEDAVKEAKRCMNCGICSECMECEKVCEPDAICHDAADETLTIDAGAVILTPGVKLFDANIKKEYGYDRYDNVITSIQFERILSSSGPTKGEVLRPSDQRHPKKIAFIQCVGSRDSFCGNEFCSSVCCMYSIKQSVIAKEHDSEIEPTIFFIDIRSFGKDFERYYENAKNEAGVNFVRCMISKVYETAKSKNLIVKYIDSENKIQEAEFDLVVLAVGLTDPTGLTPLAKKLGIEINEDEFVKIDRNKPGLTSKNGVYIAGTYAEPKDIPETVTEGSSAASLVSELLKSARGDMIQKKEYPPQRNIEDEDIRIGVFVCCCGRNIASIVNVPEVVKHASTLKNVVYAGDFLYSCSKDSLDILKEKITEYDLNRVVVASCTPRTHEELFRDTVREAGLNKYLFEMVSLREQVSWVHKNFPKEATQKSKELIDMMVAKVELIKPLSTQLSDVVQKALVVGAGASGMRAALSVANQGYEVYLVEKEDSLGGNLQHLYDNLDGSNPQEYLKFLIKEVNSCKDIQVMRSSEVKSLSGYTGNYTSIIESKKGDQEINYGVIIVATGAENYEPKANEFGYGASSNIITQVDLEETLARDEKIELQTSKTFVMIQCVGSRNDEHPYCSRVCCTQAIKNAIKLKKLNPEHRIIILYRDIRTYGFLEKYYLQARESGVLFLRYEVDKQPEVNINNLGIKVRHRDAQLNDEINLEPDYLILSTGIVAANNEKLAKTLKLPITADGFFMEAHPKIRPLDFTSEGMFFCGLAHSPRFLHESLAQAQGASIRAVTIISKESIEAKAITAMVNERLCKGCGLCVSACPFDARKLNEESGVVEVIDVLCQGCGACVVACPSGATIHKGFTRKQIMSMINKAAK